MAIKPLADDGRPRLLSFPGSQRQVVAKYIIRCQGQPGASWPEPTWCYLQSHHLDDLARMWVDHIEEHHPYLEACGEYYAMTHDELKKWFCHNGVKVEATYIDGTRVILA